MSKETMPRCPAMGCVHNFFCLESKTTQCRLLTECLMNPETGDCPFFVKPAAAEESRRRAARRAAEKKLYNTDGTYSQRFTRVRWVQQKDGSEKAEITADIPAWLDNLAKDGVITQEYANSQKWRYQT